MQFYDGISHPNESFILWGEMFKDVGTTAIKIFKVMKDQEYDEVTVIIAELAGTNHLAELLIS